LGQAFSKACGGFGGNAPKVLTTATTQVRFTGGSPAPYMGGEQGDRQDGGGTQYSSRVGMVQGGASLRTTGLHGGSMAALLTGWVLALRRCENQAKRQAGARQ